MWGYDYKSIGEILWLGHDLNETLVYIFLPPSDTKSEGIEQVSEKYRRFDIQVFRVQIDD